MTQYPQLWLSGSARPDGAPADASGLWIVLDRTSDLGLCVGATGFDEVLHRTAYDPLLAAAAAASLSTSVLEGLGDPVVLSHKDAADVLTIILLLDPAIGGVAEVYERCDMIGSLSQALAHLGVHGVDRGQKCLELLAVLGSINRGIAEREAVVHLSDPVVLGADLDISDAPKWLVDMVVAGPGGMTNRNSDQRVHCLWIDDEVDLPILVRGMFRREIRSESCKFTFTTRGEAALEILAEPNDIDLVLTDINMPGMDGFKLTQMIKDLYPQLDVYMVTAYGDPSNIRHAMREGVRDFIPKPLDRDRIKACLARRLMPFPVCEERETDDAARISTFYILTGEKYLPNLLTGCFRERIRQGLLRFRLFDDLNKMLDTLDGEECRVGVILEKGGIPTADAPVLASLLRWVKPGMTVTVVGGAGELDDYREYMARGVYDFVPRPMPVDDLAEMVNHAANRWLERVGGKA